MNTNEEFKYVVRTCVCNTIEIDKRFEMYWKDKAIFSKEDAYELLLNLKEVYNIISDSSKVLTEAKRIEFGSYMFDKAYIMLYKTRKVIIYDGKNGEIPLKDEFEVKYLIDLLEEEVNNINNSIN